MTQEAAPCAVEAWLTHREEIRRYVVHRLGDQAAADDLLQDIFIRAARRGKEFCAVVNPRAWLFEVARNAIADGWRAQHPTEELPDDLVDEVFELPAIDALAACLPRVLGEMAADDAAILRACDLTGMRLQDFADANGLSLPAAKSRVQRARRRLRQLLVQNCKVRLDATGQVCCHTPRAEKHA